VGDPFLPCLPVVLYLRRYCGHSQSATSPNARILITISVAPYHIVYKAAGWDGVFPLFLVSTYGGTTVNRNLQPVQVPGLLTSYAVPGLTAARRIWSPRVIT